MRKFRNEYINKSMQDKINAVKAFHEAFKLGYRESAKANLGIEKNLLRYKLMR